MYPTCDDPRPEAAGSNGADASSATGGASSRSGPDVPRVAGGEAPRSLKGEALCDVGADQPAVLEEIEVEDLAVDGICGVY